MLPLSADRRTMSSTLLTNIATTAFGASLLVGSAHATELATQPKPAPNYVQTSDTRSPDKKNTTALHHLRQAVSAGNTEIISELLNSIANSSTSQDLLEIVRTSFDRSSPLYNPLAGDKFAQRIITSGNKKFSGLATVVAGQHYRSSPLQPDREKAAFWFRKALSFEVHNAHIFLGDLYSRETHRSDQLQKALYHYKEAARLVSVAPLIAFARKIARLNSQGIDCGINHRSIVKAHLKDLETEAKSGKRGAAKELGRLHLAGIYVKKDINVAAEWLRPIALAGDSGALKDMAKIYLSQPANAETHDKAIKLLEISGKKGNGSSYATLAKIYLKKNDSESDERAFQLYKKSVDAGFFDGLQHLAKVYNSELLLNRNPDRIKRISYAFQHLNSLLPDASLSVNASRVASSGSEPDRQGIDTIVVGAITPQTAIAADQRAFKSERPSFCISTENFQQSVALGNNRK